MKPVCRDREPMIGPLSSITRKTGGRTRSPTDYFAQSYFNSGGRTADTLSSRSISLVTHLFCIPLSLSAQSSLGVSVLDRHRRGPQSSSTHAHFAHTLAGFLNEWGSHTAAAEA